MKKEHSIYDAIEKRQKNYFDAIEEHKRNLAKAEADRKKADAAMSDAVLNGNAAEWSKAKEALNEASDAIEFYKLQLSNAEKAPLFENVADRHRRRTETKRI